MTDREKAVAEYLAVTQANLLTAFLIKDLHKIYKVGNDVFAGLHFHKFTNEKKI